MDSSNLNEQIQTLRLARRSKPFTLDPSLPADSAAAYSIASAQLQAGGGTVGAWKLGATTALTRAAFATDKIYFGALREAEVHQGDLPAGAGPCLPTFRGEAEIALRMAKDLTAAQAADLQDPAGVFDAFAPALECPWSVVADLPAAGLMALLMDRCAAGLLVLGPAYGRGQKETTGILQIEQEGSLVASASARDGLLMPPEAAALAGLREIGGAGFDVAAGQWISTGGATPCVDLEHGKEVALWFDGAPVLKLDRMAISATPAR